VLQCVAVHRSKWQCIAVCCSACSAYHLHHVYACRHDEYVMMNLDNEFVVCCQTLIKISKKINRSIPLEHVRASFERLQGAVAVCCSLLQCVAVCCSVLQCVAVCCSVLQCVAAYHGMFACLLSCSNVLFWCGAVCCSVLQCVAVYCNALQYIAVCSGALQCVAVCCSALQCVAVCRSVL